MHSIRKLHSLIDHLIRLFKNASYKVSSLKANSCMCLNKLLHKARTMTLDVWFISDYITQILQICVEMLQSINTYVKGRGGVRPGKSCILSTSGKFRILQCPQNTLIRHKGQWDSILHCQLFFLHPNSKVQNIWLKMSSK